MPSRSETFFHLIAGLHQVEHAQGVDGRNLDVAVCLVIKRCRKIGGHCRDIHFTAGELAGDLVRRADQGKGIFVGGFVLLFLSISSTRPMPVGPFSAATFILAFSAGAVETGAEPVGADLPFCTAGKAQHGN